MKPKILVLGYTPDITGSNIALFRLLEEVEKELDFLLIIPNSTYLSSMAKKRNWNFQVAPIPWLTRNKSPLYWIKYVTQVIHYSFYFKKLVNTYKPDALLVNCAPNIGWLPGRWLLPQKQRPSTYWLIHELSLSPAIIFTGVRNTIQKFAEHIICVSKPVAVSYRSKTTIIPNSIPKTTPPRIQNPFTQKPLTFLWVGTASPRKGLHLIANTLKSIQDILGPVKLVLAAGLHEKYQTYYKDCLSNLTGHNIPVEHHENLENVDPFYSSGKILLQTSLEPESFSLVALEAMAHGMLVIASGEGGIRDYGCHGKNIIFHQELTESLPEFLKTLTNTPELVHHIQTAAYQTACNYFPGEAGKSFLNILPKKQNY
ncbi:MAG: glycosyltransferase [Fibrobacteria bacterium]|nr:glycosyltransferase [Fibrobacteria bacterium]